MAAHSSFGSMARESSVTRTLRAAVRGGPLRFDRTLLVVSLIAAAALALLTVVVYTHPYLPLDASIERDIQGVDVGPLLYVFAFYTAIGGPLAIIAEVVVFGIVLLLNRQAWRLVIAAALTSGWYLLLGHLVLRPRPAVGQVLRVTEHPGASSYPSGHTILFVTYGVVLMLCLVYRFLPRSVRPAGWGIVIVLLAIGAISRMYSGAHWPTDVLAGLLIGGGWLTFVMSINWISDGVLRRPAVSQRAAPVVPAGASADPLT
jgi:membrane-associated phospholipid phosphatase